MGGGGFAEDDQAGLAQLGNDAVVGGGKAIAGGSNAVTTGDSGHGVEVFDGHGQAPEGWFFGPVAGLGDRLGFGLGFSTGLVSHHRKVAAQRGIQPFNAIEVGVDQFQGRDLSLAQQVGLVQGRSPD